MNLRLFLATLFLINFTILYSSPRSQEEVLKIANSLYSSNQEGFYKSAPARELTLIGTSATLLDSRHYLQKQSEPAFYIYSDGAQSFVIVSGDDMMPEILGYSTENIFEIDNMPENIKSWLGYYADVYQHLSNIQPRPSRYRIPTSEPSEYPQRISPLLKDIQYNQSEPYNLLCPKYAGERSVTGCVATAMAQIMRYWGYPAVGSGTVNYTTLTLGFNLAYDFSSHPFDWDNILNTYNGSESEKEKLAVANLMLACGMAAQMDYTPYASGAVDSFAYTGLIENLDYAPDYIASKSYFSHSEWMDLIKTELTAGRPVYYSGSSTQGGHAFVVDGYDERDMVHVNWGWGGYCNGYFSTLTMDAEGGGIGGYNDNSYQFRQSMFVGLAPKSIKLPDPSTHMELGSMEINSFKFFTGDRFDVTVTSLYNIGNEFQNGYIGLALEKEGIQTTLGQYQVSLKSGYGFSDIKFEGLEIPYDMEDGVYTLFAGSRPNEESKWNRALGSVFSNYYYKINIENGQCTIMSEAYDLENLEVKTVLLHNVYSGMSLGMKCNVTNNSDKSFFGEVSFLLSDLYHDYVGIIRGKYLYLEPGESTSFEINDNINVAPGEYYYSPVVAVEYYWIGCGSDDYRDISVLDPGTEIPELVVNDVSIVDSKIQQGEPLKIKARLSLKGEGKVNRTSLIHLWGTEDSQLLAYFIVCPFLENGEVLDYEYNFYADAEPGKYYYYLSTYEDGINEYIYTTEFTVGTDITTIQSVGESDNGSPYFKLTSEGDMILYSNDEIREISVVDAAGINLTTGIEKLSENIYLIKTANIKSGLYIVVAKTCDNHIATLKFNK